MVCGRTIFTYTLNLSRYFTAKVGGVCGRWGGGQGRDEDDRFFCLGSVPSSGTETNSIIPTPSLRQHGFKHHFLMLYANEATHTASA